MPNYVFHGLIIVHFTIFFRVTSRTPRQSSDFCGAREAAMVNKPHWSTNNWYHYNKTKQNKIISIFHGTYQTTLICTALFMKAIDLATQWQSFYPTWYYCLLMAMDQQKARPQTSHFPTEIAHRAPCAPLDQVFAGRNGQFRYSILWLWQACVHA